MSGNPYLKARALAEAASDSLQERNRLWWLCWTDAVSQLHCDNLFGENE